MTAEQIATLLVQAFFMGLGVGVTAMLAKGRG